MEHESAQSGTVDTQTDVLTPVQVRVLGYLLRGSTLAHAGAQTGVRRETVSRWVNGAGVFRAAYQVECERMLQRVRDSVDALCTDAIDAANADTEKGCDQSAGYIRMSMQMLQVALEERALREQDAPKLRGSKI